MHKLSMIFIDYLDALVTRGGGERDSSTLRVRVEYRWSTDGVQAEYEWSTPEYSEVQRSTSGVQYNEVDGTTSEVRVEYNTMK
jgi:hypothetical protein